LNGTVNFILTSLAHGIAFADAVRAAQQAGFAEPDPTADLSGLDARAKIAVLAFAAFGADPDPASIKVEALDAERASRIAREGGAWKQIARIEPTPAGLSASVRFERRDDDPFFAGALWEANAMRLSLADGRRVECRGKGAGRRPTVESILGDLGTIRRARLDEALAIEGLTPEKISA
jgi:homoserine dehydrogenase